MDGERTSTQPVDTFIGYGVGEGQDRVVLPLVLQMECTATKQEMNGNVAATLARGYESVLPHIYTQSGAVSICGAGPSLKRTLDEITGDVFAVNSAIPFLMKRGIVPRWAMIWDCDPICAQFAEPHPDTTYLVASRCHPSVFEKLKDCRVVVWHAAGDYNILDVLKAHFDRIDPERTGMDEPLIQGGTTGITRGLYLAYALGYRELHIFGADSCYEGDDTHVDGKSLVYEHSMPILCGGKWFRSTPQWAEQIEEIKIMWPMFKLTGLCAEIIPHDDGLFRHVIDIMKLDEQKALREAEALAEFQKTRHIERVLPEGTIKAIAGEHPEWVEEPMRSLCRP